MRLRIEYKVSHSTQGGTQQASAVLYASTLGRQPRLCPLDSGFSGSLESGVLPPTLFASDLPPGHLRSIEVPAWRCILVEEGKKGVSVSCSQAHTMMCPSSIICKIFPVPCSVDG
jgi:hypothetical protein